MKFEIYPTSLLFIRINNQFRNTEVNEHYSGPAKMSLHETNFVRPSAWYVCSNFVLLLFLGELTEFSMQT
jgi:hypothetical protein